MNDDHVLLPEEGLLSELRANRKWIVSEFGGYKWVSPAKDTTGRAFPLVSSDDTLVRGAVLHSTSQ